MDLFTPAHFHTQYADSFCCINETLRKRMKMKQNRVVFKNKSHGKSAKKSIEKKEISTAQFLVAVFFVHFFLLVKHLTHWFQQNETNKI